MAKYQKAVTHVVHYNVRWNVVTPAVNRELECIIRGGQWENNRDEKCGMGLLFHYLKAIEIAWPDVKLNRWLRFFAEQWVDHKYIGVLGPKNCVAGETRILDAITGNEPTVQELYESGTAPTVMTLSGPALASVPFIKGMDDLYEITLENGDRFRATAGHRVLTPFGYQSVSSLSVGSQLSGYERVLLPSISGSALSIRAGDDRRWTGKVSDFSGDYPLDFCSDDGRPLREAGSAQGGAPSQAGVQERDFRDLLLSEGVRDGKSRCNLPFQPIGHLSSLQPPALCAIGGTFFLPRMLEEILERASGSFQYFEQSHQWICAGSPLRESTPDFSKPLRFPSSCGEVWGQQTRVASINFVRRDVFYDLHVPGPNHYFAEGVIHHNSGKTATAALLHLIDYYAFPHKTTVLVCSTTKEALEDRIWGEIKKHHKEAQRRCPWLPGHLIEGRMRIITDDSDESTEGRDFRNGFVGVPCKKGNQYVGIADFVGRKNARMRLLGDEIQFLPQAFIDATSNLDSGSSDFKATGMGNPKETTDSLGLLCEPAAFLGGWDSGIDQTPGTKVWETKFNRGCAIQFPGSDTPNNDEPKDEFPFLISQAQLDRDAKQWGTDDWHYTMFDEGRMPRGQGSRRVITRQLCLRGGAMDEPHWHDTNVIRIASLDSAFRAVGGDRCVFTRCCFGAEGSGGAIDADGTLNVGSLPGNNAKRRNIFAMLEQKVIPLTAGEIKGAVLSVEEAEDQIVKFVMRECQQYNIAPENFFFDAGMKASLVAAFARLWSPQVRPVDFDGKPSERKVSTDIDVSCRDYYFNFVTEMWYSVRMCIDAGQFRGLTETVMLEGCKREFQKVSGNKIQVEPKHEMKAKTGQSPDCFDSLVISLEGARQRGFMIERLAAKEYQEQDHTWKREMREKEKNYWKSGQLTYT